MLLAALALASPLRAQAPGEDTLSSVRECGLRYRVHGGDAPPSQPAAIIAHGFLRDGTFMSGWAEAIARSGVRAVTVDLCASSTATGTHADNGADLVAVRRHLGIRDVVYIGVSAGGLAALVAASQDAEATRGVLLLDPTNAGGFARTAAAVVDAPVAALIARPQVCNAWRNIDPALKLVDDATIVRIDRASHCDFEWPTDNFCRVMCLERGGRDERQRSQARIRTIGVAFVEAIVRGDDAALEQWKADIADRMR
jgi:pimeloyl-ACP methyl ester carboxylesterase